MEIEIKRWGDNGLYVEGRLIVNDKMSIPYTVEYHDDKLEAGTYQARLKKHGDSVTLVIDDGQGHERPLIGGHSFYSSWKEKAIVVGDRLIPGATIHGHDHLDRLIDRLRKAVRTGKPVTVTVTEDEMTQTTVARHWLEADYLACFTSHDDPAGQELC